MENKKSLDELINEATAISPEREEEIRKNAIKTSNEIFKEMTVSFNDSMTEKFSALYQPAPLDEE